MLLETYDWFLDPRQLSVLIGAVLGLFFGAAAQITRFCLRRAVAGDVSDRAPAGAVWLTAFITAIVGFLAAQQAGLIAVADHRFLSSELPIAAILLGGLMFGAGMVLTRGCISRLTVLGATGNLRAISVVVLFALIAHATLKGVFAPLRTALGSVTVDMPIASLAEVPALAGLLVVAAIGAVVHLIRKAKPSITHLILGTVIGLTPVLGWAATSVLFFDEFDPLPVQSMAFTLPWTDSLFWFVASSAIPAGFGTGMVGGVLLGAFTSAALRKELKLQSFENAAQTGRYGLGAILMGVGGVLAGGCTVGAGLSGAAMLSIAALLALGAIAVGAVVARTVLDRPAVLVPAG